MTRYAKKDMQNFFSTFKVDFWVENLIFGIWLIILILKFFELHVSKIFSGAFSWTSEHRITFGQNVPVFGLISG